MGVPTRCIASRTTTSFAGKAWLSRRGSRLRTHVKAKPSRTFPLLFFAGIACFVALSCGHFWHLSTLFENDRFFSHLSRLEREMTFRTEQGLYYSFYARLTEAPSLWNGLISFVRNNRTEHPETINFLQRFNLYPELALGISYRAFSTVSKWFDIQATNCWEVIRGAGHPAVTSCVGLGDPFYFYLTGVFALNGLLLGVLFCAGWLLSENIFGGLLTVSCFLFNHGEGTRVMWTPPLRESFGYPFFVMEMVAVSYMLRMRHRSVMGSAFVGIFVALFLMQWQFAQFVLLTQLLILMGMFLVGFIQFPVLFSILAGFTGGILFGYAALFGNSMLLYSLVAMFAIGTYGCFLVLDSSYFAEFAKSWCPGFAVGDLRTLIGRIAVVSLPAGLLVAKFLLVEPASSKTDDSHIWDILRSKLTSYRNFHTMLYTCAPEFDFLGWDVVTKLSQTLLLPCACFISVMVGGLVFIRVLHIALPLEPETIKKENGKDALKSDEDYNYSGKCPTATYSPVTNGPMLCSNGHPSPPKNAEAEVDLDSIAPPEIVYNILQSGVFACMAGLIMRLKLLWTPQLCVLCSLLASRSMFRFLRRPWHAAVVMAVWCCMAYDGFSNLQKQHQIVGEYSNYPLEEMLLWIRKETPEDAVFGGPMATMANLHLSTNRPVVNHPHYENAAIRARTKMIYSMYSRKGITRVHGLLRKLGVQYAVFENSYCWRAHRPGCTMLNMWDVEDPSNRYKEPLCRILTEDEHVWPFRRVFDNDVYTILKV